ncbi:HelD family protein [Bailinhaonella thermotolerans]|uniref:AAA family ATPase n=1 Tax=Bailinhaonella thermotolerans TaxID=1070861 RepID=A0A3A4BPR5_9ACTN|nr:AAA family ATPase [Bailinhaonella thermotolerans]RJL33136.1 AAA family ATPase [Bailinhaonella thermotolerans]
MPAHQPAAPLAPDITETTGGQADPADVILAAERAHLAHSRAALRRMREHAQSLSSDAAGDWVSQQVLEALLDQRIAALADHPDTPLFFGRVDRATAPAAGPTGPVGPTASAAPVGAGAAGRTAGAGAAGGRAAEDEDDLPRTMYIGRRHVHDESGLALVIDWRAPVSRAFYQASPADPMGLELRRRFGYHGGELTAFEDEPLDRGGTLGPSRILTEEIERPRTGPMRDIVATIQPDQDEIVRAALGQTVCVQGAPGTGKTAVGLHRAAYLLFTHREKLSRSGVLIVGPNRAFLSYISSVLPALGEVRVDQSTLGDLLREHAAPEAAVPEDDAVAAIKGDARMAEVLRRALWQHVTKPEEGLVHVKGASRYRVADYEVREIAASLRGTTRYGPGRNAFAQRLAHAVLVRMEQRGEAPDDRVQDAVARSKPVKRLVEAVWPKLTPQQVLFTLLSDAEALGRAAKDILTEEEQAAILWRKSYRSAKSARWSAADAALLDELADLIERTPTRGHIVVDEAQDLSPMQLRALGRRCATGSATVLGDLAQGTTPWSARSWTEVLAHLGQDGQVTELTMGFRVPREVLDFAARLLPSVAPELALPRSLRPGQGSLTVRRAAAEPAPGALSGEVLDLAVDACRTALGREGSVGLIAADADVPALREALTAAGLACDVLDGSGDETERLLLVPATLAKGLEYDHVIVAEPARVVAAEPRGLARLYVVLTRAVTSLTVVHAEPLPAQLA